MYRLQLVPCVVSGWLLLITCMPGGGTWVVQPTFITWTPHTLPAYTPFSFYMPIPVDSRRRIYPHSLHACIMLPHHLCMSPHPVGGGFYLEELDSAFPHNVPHLCILCATSCYLFPTHRNPTDLHHPHHHHDLQTHVTQTFPHTA